MVGPNRTSIFSSTPAALAIRWIRASVLRSARSTSCVFAAAETALFVGLIVPGETVLLLAGVLAWRGDLNLGGAIAAERSSVSDSTAPSAIPHWPSVRSSGSGWCPAGATRP